MVSRTMICHDFELMQLTLSPSDGSVGHEMENLLQSHFSGKKGFTSSKLKMFAKSMRLCNLWPTLGCGLYTVAYGSHYTHYLYHDIQVIPEEGVVWHIIHTYPT